MAAHSWAVAKRVGTQGSSDLRVLNVVPHWQFYLFASWHDSVNSTVVLIRNAYAGTNVIQPYKIAGKQQRDPVTGAPLNISLPTITLEFDSFSNYDWGFGNGITNASSNLLTNCWGALTSKDAWLGKKYHISSCTAEVRFAV
jgi:hypothetical protein